MNARGIVKRLYQGVRSRLLDIGGPRDAILQSGMGRSGTTWVGDLINHDGSYRVLFEPFFPGMVPEAEGFEYYQYLRPESDVPELAERARRILAGKPRGNWVDRDNRGVFYRRRIVKEIRVNLMLGWLRRIAGGLPIVLTIRHPFQVAASWSKLGWGKVAPGERHDLDILIKQDALLKDFPVVAEVYRDLDLSDYLQATVFKWCLFYHVPRVHLQAGEAHPLVYERLLSDPETEIAALFGYLGRPVPAPEVLRALLAKSSSTNFLNRDHAEDRSRLADGWRTMFSPDQIRRSREILTAFELDDLYHEDGSPNDAAYFPRPAGDGWRTQAPSVRSGESS